MTEITERVVKEALLKQRARTMATIYLTEMYCKWRPLRYLSVFNMNFQEKLSNGIVRARSAGHLLTQEEFENY